MSEPVRHVPLTSKRWLSQLPQPTNRNHFSSTFPLSHVEVDKKKLINLRICYKIMNKKAITPVMFSVWKMLEWFVVVSV